MEKATQELIKELKDKNPEIRSNAACEIDVEISKSFISFNCSFG